MADEISSSHVHVRADEFGRKDLERRYRGIRALRFAILTATLFALMGPSTAHAQANLEAREVNLVPKVLQGTPSQVGAWSTKTPVYASNVDVRSPESWKTTWGYDEKRPYGERFIPSVRTPFAPIDAMTIVVNGVEKRIEAYANVDKDGKKIDGPFQCTALVSQYLSVLGFENAPKTIPNGRDVVETLARSPNNEFFEFSKREPPKVGSIVSMEAGTGGRPDGIGHVAIIKGVEWKNEKTIVATVIEQNISSAQGFAVNRTIEFTSGPDGTWTAKHQLVEGGHWYEVRSWATPVSLPSSANETAPNALASLPSNIPTSPKEPSTKGTVAGHASDRSEKTEIPVSQLRIAPEGAVVKPQVPASVAGTTPATMPSVRQFVVTPKPLFPVPPKSKEAEAIGLLVESIHVLHVLGKMASELQRIDAAPLAAATREQIRSQVLAEAGTDIITSKVLGMIQEFFVKRIAERTGWDSYQINNAINTGKNLLTLNLKGQIIDSSTLMAQSLADTINTAKHILPPRDMLSPEQREWVEQDSYLIFMYAIKEGRYLAAFADWLKAVAGESHVAWSKLREKLDQFVAVLHDEPGVSILAQPGGVNVGPGAINRGDEVRIGNLQNTVRVGGSVTTSAQGRTASTRIGSTSDAAGGAEVSGSYFTDIGGSVVNQGGVLEINPIQGCETRRDGRCCIEINRGHCVVQKYTLSQRAFRCASGYERDGRTCYRYSDKEHRVER